MDDAGLEHCCKECFYRYRASSKSISSCCKHGNKIEVFWNEYEEFYETTVVRSPPSDLVEKAWGNVRLCEPRRRTCRRDNCTFAHGTEEQTKWNEFLRQQRKRRGGHTFYSGPRGVVHRPSGSLPHVQAQRHLHPQAKYQPRHPLYQPPSSFQSNVRGSLSRPFPPFHRQAMDCLTDFKTSNLESIKRKLNRSNYKDKFKNLIISEETTHIEILGEKCNSRCDIILYNCQPDWIKSVHRSSGRVCGRIEGLDRDKIAYVTQASEAAFAKSRNDEVKIEILRENNDHCDECLFIALDHKNAEKLFRMFSTQNQDGVLKDIPIAFKIKQLFFNLLYKSVNEIKPEIIDKILPASDKFLPFQQQVKLPPRAKDFDEDQGHALQTILASDSKSPPILVSGSFGTGKTRLIATASCCLLEQTRQPTRILICAHHQATLDDLVENYLGPELEKHQRPTFQLIRLIPRNYRFGSSKYEKYYKFSRQAHDICKNSRLGDIIVVTTFLTSLSLTSIGNKFFTHILVDEGSQTREPEAIAPLSLASPNTKIVIAGDKYQVGPALLVLGEEARENGLKYSLLERLHKHYKDLGGTALAHMVELKTNYRCNAEIMKLPNQLFYEGKVIPRPIRADTHPDFKYPLVFICSSLSKKVDHALEAKILLHELYQRVVCKWPRREWGSEDLSKVSLITASRPQLVLMRHLARRKYGNQMRYIRFLTTYTIQGTEFQALFVSTSEYVNDEGTTNPTKSPCDRYIFNTLLTRSKSLVVAVGSPLQLLHIESQMKDQQNLCWNLYMRECIKNNTFIVPPVVERSEVVVQQFIESIKVKLTPTNFGGSQPTSASSEIAIRKIQSGTDDGQNPVAAPSRSPNVVLKTTSQFTPAMSEQTSTTDPLKITSRQKTNSQGVTATVAGNQIASSNNAGLGQESSSAISKSAEVNDLDFPVLDGFKVSKKETRELQAKEKKIKNSKNNAIPHIHSKWYEEYEMKLESGCSILEDELTPYNYKEKFHHLLCWEEKEHDKQISEKCDGVYDVHIYGEDYSPKNISYEDEERFGYIDSDNGDILSHAKQASEGSFIILENDYIYARHVHARPPYNANFSAISIAIEKKEVEKLKKSRHYKDKVCHFKAKVKFELKHSYFQRLHNAIKHLPEHVISKLNPTVEELSCCQTERLYYYHSPPPPYECLQLDETQKKALHVVLNSSAKFPILVAGPFGTGKTRMLARAAYDILGKPKSRVLICAHHQASVDTFVDYFGKIMEKQQENPWVMNMVRIIPHNSYKSKTRDNYNRYFISVTDISEEMLETCRLVITTLGTAPRLFHKIREIYNSFSDILIDEGAQTREPETVGPLCLARKFTRIIIAGDHCQVGPRLLVLGKKPQDHGLGKSLLERMHTIYDKANLPINTYSVTLLTNYRCHAGVLMLPSSLFYHSTLQCCVKDRESHPESPFPLNFVCSSMEEDVRNISGVNPDEIEVLLKEAQKYFCRWPKNWSKKDRRVCIMSPSANQCSELRKKLKGKALDCSTEILKAYDIQGTEFKAIFVSTSEPTSESGGCIYETKSISDRYVFNTAITRSRALVVAVGNPFLLLKLENQMVDKYGEDARCWTPYIRQCIECNTFSYSEKLRNNFNKSTSDKLFDMIYSRSFFKTLDTSKPLDSIIKAYKRVFEKLEECKKMKRLLLSSKGEKISWKMEDYKDLNDTVVNDDNSHHTMDPYECTLEAQNYYMAKAIPVDSSRHIVIIQGSDNRRGAFDGDTVKVGVFKDCLPEYYGQVQGVSKRGSNLKFICKVSRTNSIVFLPTDEKNPPLINLPRLSLDLLKKKEIDDINKSDLKSKDVVIFKVPPKMEEGEIEDIVLPQIKQVIPLSVAKNMLFLVSFVKWNPKYRCPLGIVEGVFPKGFTRFNAERLLTFQHNVDYNDDNTEDHFDECDSIQENQDLVMFSQVFTIDPEGAKNLDDALSIAKHSTNDVDQTVYQLGVHIVNAAKHIVAHSDDDNAAKALGISAYGGREGKVMHMLGSRKLRSQLSLTPEKVRDVISVTCLFTLNPAHLATLNIESVDIKLGQVRSSMQLTYADAQLVLEGKTPQHCVEAAKSFVDISLCHSMKLLYDVAFAMRLRRMQSDAAYAYDVSDPGEESCWQAHLLVEELMIWANNEVARQIHSYCPNAALLRRQPPPNQNKIRELVNENKSVMINSLSLCHYLRQEYEVHPSSIMVPIDILKKLKKALQRRDLGTVAYYLTANKCYPQLAAVEHEIHSIYLRAEYCCTEESKKNPSEYHHSSLNLDEYTHFSSPMRRYFDIEVQRMVLETLKKPSSEQFSHEQNKQLCLLLNTKMHSIKLFEKKVNQVDLSFEFLSTSKVYPAFVVSNENRFIELQFSDLKLKSFPKKSLKLVVSNFSLFFSVVSLKHTNMADVLSSHHINSASSNTSLGELKAIYVPKNSSSKEAKNKDLKYSALSLAKYNLSFESLAIEIPADHWKQALDLVKMPLTSLTEENGAALTKIFKTQPHCDVPAISSDNSEQKWLYIECKLKYPWDSPGVLKTWLSWSMRDHIISPIVQIVELSPLFRFCIQHSSHPAECFSDLNLSHASKKNYENIKEYIKLWTKLLLAEAAEKSVKECRPVVLRDISLEWPELIIPKVCINEVYYTPSNAVKMIIPWSFVDECFEFFKIKIGCLVCLRCEDRSVSGTKAVFHLVVHHIEEDREQMKEMIVYMKHSGDVNCRISEEMKKMLVSKDCVYEVQVMPMSVSYRKVFAGLLRLSNSEESSELSQNVAVDISDLTDCPPTEYSIDQLMAYVDDEFAMSISSWSTKLIDKQISLNKWQKQAVRLALSKRFQLIQGPPGTGKSETGAHIAYILAMLNQRLFNTKNDHNCVFYCGPSNKSVDVVLEKFSDLFKQNTQPQQSLKVLRIYSSSVEKKYYPDPSSKPLSTSTAECPEWAKKFALHHLLREASNCREIPELRELSEVEETINKIKSENKLPSGYLIKQHREALNEATKAFLEKNKFDIVFCTCNEASGIRAKMFSVRQCIIDESGMAYEPESIVPLRLCEHAVLIGDHKQLQPVIDYGPAKKCGLSKSLFERYAVEYGQTYTWTLKIQYRMHKEICQFPSIHFYSNQLETDGSVLSRTNPETRIEGFWPRGPNMPIAFVNLVGEEDSYHRRGEDENVKVRTESKSNLKEAMKVVEIARTLHVKHKIPVNEMAVLTPYSAQKDTIKKVVNDEPKPLNTLLVVSISESQGNEFGIVILSTVRSQPVAKIRNKHIIQADRIWLRENLGFITDKHQINVGITRSKYGLIIIGNKTLLSYDDTWEKLLHHYEGKRCIVEGTKFPLI